jgi:hypothetical protein
MSLYITRYSRFPRPVTQDDARSGLTRQLGYLGQPPTTRDVLNPSPMPVYPDWAALNTGAMANPEYQHEQLPGPFVGRDLPPHLYMPRNGENFDLQKSVLFAPVGNTVTILSFRIPIGRNCIINKVATNFIGGGWIAGTGDVIWRILVDGALPPGANTYNAIDDSLGSPAQPVGIAGFRVFENQLLTVTAFNNPAGANGGVVFANQRVGARLLGHMYPRDMEYQDLFV